MAAKLDDLIRTLPTTSIAITGGTGSFGQVFVRECLNAGVDRIVIVSRDEYKQAVMAEAFKADADRLRFFLGDVRDKQRLEQTFIGVDTVVHAAALKRVQESVYSPSELIKTNINGTMNVIEAAAASRVGRVLLISSDKAVEATNLYGKTKACAEDYAVQANAYTYPVGTRVAVVRYGNVLNSRGSVLNIWKEQRDKVEPLTLTDPYMTRFIISLRQATDLVKYALRHMQGGEIYVPLIPSSKVTDLADAIYGSGYPKKFIGIRPGGEKLHEDLLSREEVSRVTQPDDKYLLVKPTFNSWTMLPYPGKEFWAREYSSAIGCLTVDKVKELLTQEGIIAQASNAQGAIDTDWGGAMHSPHAYR